MQQRPGWWMSLPWQVLGHHSAEHSASTHRAGWNLPVKPMFYHPNVEWGNRDAAPIQPWKSDLEPFLATTREMFIPICCEIPPSQIHLSVPCAYKIHLLISVVVVKKHVSRQWDSSTPWILGVWRKVALGCISEIFAVYLSGWFIQGGFNVFFYSKTHPIGQAVF